LQELFPFGGGERSKEGLGRHKGIDHCLQNSAGPGNPGNSYFIQIILGDPRISVSKLPPWRSGDGKGKLPENLLLQSVQEDFFSPLPYKNPTLPRLITKRNFPVSCRQAIPFEFAGSELSQEEKFILIQIRKRGMTEGGVCSSARPQRHSLG
jgi:hypothetical protein